ncbi:hypothetical protein AAEJ42_17365 [Shewanella algae]|uniref:hypothetical protein n=1 Tax=Shewanella algae TaxID=38313 RepID=UPI00313B5598
MTKQAERKQVSLLAALAGLSFMGYMLGSIFVGAIYSQLLGALMLGPIFVAAIYLAYREQSKSNEGAARYWFRILFFLGLVAVLLHGITEL